MPEGGIGGDSGQGAKSDPSAPRDRDGAFPPLSLSPSLSLRRSPPSPILLFDGVCNLCHRSVRFVLEHERAPTVKFAALQSATGAQLLRAHALPEDYAHSLVLIEDGRAFVGSTAALRVARHLRAPWRWLAALGVVPQPIRDRIYRFIAERRYRWFGQREACLVPTPARRERFLP